MSKKTLKKILSRVADIDKALAVIRRAVETREKQSEALKFDTNAEKVVALQLSAGSHTLARSMAVPIWLNYV